MSRAAFDHIAAYSNLATLEIVAALLNTRGTLGMSTRPYLSQSMICCIHLIIERVFCQHLLRGISVAYRLLIVADEGAFARDGASETRVDVLKKFGRHGVFA